MIVGVSLEAKPAYLDARLNDKQLEAFLRTPVSVNKPLNLKNNYFLTPKEDTKVTKREKPNNSPIVKQRRPITSISYSQQQAFIRSYNLMVETELRRRDQIETEEKRFRNWQKRKTQSELSPTRKTSFSTKQPDQHIVERVVIRQKTPVIFV